MSSCLSIDGKRRRTRRAHSKTLRKRTGRWELRQVLDCASPSAFAVRHSAASARRRLALWPRALNGRRAKLCLDFSTLVGKSGSGLPQSKTLRAIRHRPSAPCLNRPKHRNGVTSLAMDSWSICRATRGYACRKQGCQQSLHSRSFVQHPETARLGSVCAHASYFGIFVDLSVHTSCNTPPSNELKILNSVAVGTPIAERPPLRSVRAQFTHTAPTSGG